MVTQVLRPITQPCFLNEYIGPDLLQCMADATGYTALQEVAVQYQFGGNSHSSIEVAQLMARSWQQTTCGQAFVVWFVIVCYLWT